MQAIILAAGMGRRLKQLTAKNTKCMVSINGERLIDRTLNALNGLNLRRIIIVVGYRSDNLIKHIGKRQDNVKIEFIHNDIYDKTNNIYSLALAKDKMEEDDTILLESDIIFNPEMLKILVDNPYPNIALVAKWSSWMDGTVVKIDEKYNIVSMVPKEAFNFSETDQYYKTVNIYKFSKEFAKRKYNPFLEAYCKSMGYSAYYEQVLNIITYISANEMKALPVRDLKWFEIDDIQDKEIAEILTSDPANKVKRISSLYGGYWRFPDLIDFCYLVNPYFPTQHLKEEIKTSFDTLLTNYPSGMAVNSMLAGKSFNVNSEHIVVGNGAAELIKSLMESLSGKVGVTYPTFEEYPNRMRDENLVKFIPSNKEYRYSTNDLKNFFEGTGISTLLLVNPDNPSGNFIPKDELLDLIAWCKNKGIMIVVDESFVDFADNGTANTLIDEVVLGTYSNLIVMKSISKSYGVPGLRLGLLASSNTELVGHIKKDVSIWNINSFAEFFMQILDKYKHDYETACEDFRTERLRFMRELEQIEWIHVLPSQANYFLIKILGKYSSGELTSILLSKFNILIKDCDHKSGLEGKNFIRIAIRNTEDNNLLLQALRSL